MRRRGRRGRVVFRYHLTKGWEGCFGRGRDGDMLKILEGGERVFKTRAFFRGLEGLKRWEERNREIFARKRGGGGTGERECWRRGRSFGRGHMRGWRFITFIHGY